MQESFFSKASWRRQVIQQKRGFTLIEILVVVVIIGLLAAVVLASLGGARERGRDGRRQADIKQIALAMELFFDSQDPIESYPDLPNTAVAIPGSSSIGSFINPVPLDPLNSGSLVYIWTDGGTPLTKFCVWALLEATSSTTYFVANPKGAKNTTTVPNVGNCDTL